MIGYIGFSRNDSNFMSRAIRFFTRSKWSHSFIGFFSVQSEPSIIEAVFAVTVAPFNSHYKEHPDKVYELYKIRHADVFEVQRALSFVYREFAGTYYGVFQLIWFCYRALMELFGRDVSHEKNWMTDGVICSELVYNYLLQFDNVKPRLLALNLNSDTVQPEDLHKFINNNLDLFERV